MYGELKRQTLESNMKNRSPLTTNQMIKLFAKVLADAPPVQLSKAELAAIRAACKGA